jgi:hypothetical protein
MFAKRIPKNTEPIIEELIDCSRCGRMINKYANYAVHDTKNNTKTYSCKIDEKNCLTVEDIARAEAYKKIKKENELKIEEIKKTAAVKEKLKLEELEKTLTWTDINMDMCYYTYPCQHSLKNGGLLGARTIVEILRKNNQWDLASTKFKNHFEYLKKEIII